MNQHRQMDELRAAISVSAAYILWGLLPIYWKLLLSVPPAEVLCNRIVWCVGFMVFLIAFQGKWQSFKTEITEIFRTPKRLAGIAAAALFLNLNWFTYIWAVMNNRVVETSLGYYINPLFSVLLGILFLKEKLNRWQIAAFGLALLGVLNLTFRFGALPWVALMLAFTFGIYSLLKKTVHASATTGLTLETMILGLPALVYLTYLHAIGSGAFLSAPLPDVLLLIGAGGVTGIPLLLFASGALRLSLTLVGFLQYFSPTIGLLLGVFLWHEPFTRIHLISFALIWTGLIVFTVSESRQRIQARSDSDLSCD